MTVYNGKLYAGTLPLGPSLPLRRRRHLDPHGAARHHPRREVPPGLVDGRLPRPAVRRHPSFRPRLRPAGGCQRHPRPRARTRLAPPCRRSQGRGGSSSTSTTAASRPRRPCDASAFDLSTDQPLRIGAGAIDTFNGRLRDLRLYRRALADDDIRRLAS